jgi:hypothetical protein
LAKEQEAAAAEDDFGLAIE